MNFSEGSLDDLVREGLLKRGEFTQQQVRAHIHMANEHMDTARHQQKPGPKHHYAYQAILSAVCAVLSQREFRLASGGPGPSLCGH